MAFDTHQQRRAALNYGGYPLVLPFPTGAIDAASRAIVVGSYSYLTTPYVPTSVYIHKARFWELRDWMDFDLDGEVYMKTRMRYTPGGSPTNAIHKTTGALLYIIPKTKVLTETDLHDYMKTPLACGFVIRRLGRYDNPV